MDIADMGNDRAEEILQDALNAVKRNQQSLPDVGSCYFCSEDLPQGLRFCNSECRDDFDKEVRLKSIKGSE